MSDLVGNLEEGFFRDAAHFKLMSKLHKFACKHDETSIDAHRVNDNQKLLTQLTNAGQLLMETALLKNVARL